MIPEFLWNLLGFLGFMHQREETRRAGEPDPAEPEDLFDPEQEEEG